MPVIDLINSGNQIITITEHTTNDEKNYLRVMFNNGTYSACTEDYDPSYWHYFWIVYDGSTLAINVDGIDHTLMREVGALPASISGNLLEMYINHSFSGYSNIIAKHYGYLDDLFIRNGAVTRTLDIQRTINLGVDYVVDKSLTDKNVEPASIFMNDPTTISVTSSVDDASYVLLGRNDGKIMRGSSLMWETRKVYNDAKEATLLGVSTTSTDADNVSDGFLNLSSKIVRL